MARLGDVICPCFRLVIISYLGKWGNPTSFVMVEGFVKEEALAGASASFCMRHL